MARRRCMSAKAIIDVGISGGGVKAGHAELRTRPECMASLKPRNRTAFERIPNHRMQCDCRTARVTDGRPNLLAHAASGHMRELLERG